MVRRKSTARSQSARSASTTKSSEPQRNNARTEVVVNRNRTARRTMRALQEIKYLRKTTGLLIPKLPFARLVREILFDLFPRENVSRLQASALEALQESAEMYLTQFFEDAVLLTFHAKRVTLMRNDMILMRRLRGRDDVINK